MAASRDRGSRGARHPGGTGRRRIRPLTYPELRRAGDAARKRYRGHRNVLDVGVGLKFEAGAPVADQLCIQFCVSRKTRARGRSRLPRFVYARRRDGSVDRRRRVPTDVVVVKAPRFACAAGSRLDAPGEFGTETLLFRNASDGLYYLVTCAHVAGDLHQSPPADPRLDCACCPGTQFATTVLNSVHEGGIVQWDVALARLEPACTPQPVLRIEGSPGSLRRLRPQVEIVPGAWVECATARSGVFPARVASDARAFHLILDGTEYLVRNLLLMQAQPAPGDSGGLVHVDDEAVGILVGVAGDDAPGSQGWGLFQPLEGALDHLAEHCGFPLSVFP
jgi:hypothetical protein